ncbi:MAG: hypothetical protein U1F87_14945 [Kiritimatiellia bacterium]
MTETSSSPGFQFFRQLNTVDDRSWIGSKTTFTLVTARRYFPSESRRDRLARALGGGAAPIKEVLECCEFFEHPPGDAGAGGGRPLLRPRSAGPALPLFEKGTREVHLLDERIPSQRRVVDCVAGLAPWSGGKSFVRRVWTSARPKPPARGRLHCQRPCLRSADRRRHSTWRSGSGGRSACCPAAIPSACPAPRGAPGAGDPPRL